MTKKALELRPTVTFAECFVHNINYILNPLAMPA